MLNYLQKLIVFLLFLQLTFGIFVFPVMAAEFFLNTSVLELGPQQQFQVDLLFDPQGEDINALAGEIIFNSENISLQEIIYNDSIINFWLDNPESIDDKIIFSGIIPGGFQGTLYPYSDIKDHGKVFSLIFITKNEGEADISFLSGQALLNDGQGTAAPLEFRGVSIPILSEVTTERVLAERALDYDIPEKFVPIVARDENIFDNRWFIVFSAQDKGSGISGYFVYESSKSINPSQIKQGTWQSVASPYLLQDQTLSSYIYVKAVDNAGNERVETINPTRDTSWYEISQNSVIILISLSVLILIGLGLWLKIIRKSH